MLLSNKISGFNKSICLTFCCDTVEPLNWWPGCNWTVNASIVTTGRPFLLHRPRHFNSNKETAKGKYVAVTTPTNAVMEIKRWNTNKQDLTPATTLNIATQTTPHRRVSDKLTANNADWLRRAIINIFLPSPEPSCTNPYFVTKSLRRNHWNEIVALRSVCSRSVDLARRRLRSLAG